MRIFALCATLLLVGCNGAEPARSRPPLVPDPPLQTRNSPTPMPVTQHPVPKHVMQRLYDDVTRLSGVARDDIVLERAEEATWSDTSLGCPQPNAQYMQRIVSGFWVVMHAGQEEYDFRIDHNLRHHRCTGATRRAPIKYPSST